MNILYLPIDERPCNTTIVKMIADTGERIHLISPPKHLLGKKKQPAETEKLWAWVEENVMRCEGMIFSPELMLYGGLIPSRLHDLEESHQQQMLSKLSNLKSRYPKLKIVSSTIVMRTPKYSSSDEEPAYYEHYGRALYLSHYLKDKENRLSLSAEEEQQLIELKERIPLEVITDYESRRAYNLQTNCSMLALLESGVIDFIVVPQDDSAEFGYTAEDQKKVVEFIRSHKLRKQTLVYPGSDEVGATLLARLVNEQKGHQLSIYPVYSSTLGPTLIPNYEDRPFNETLKKHIQAVGCKVASTLSEADIVLGYNTPGKVMQESWEQLEEVDSTYYSFRDLGTFVSTLQEAIHAGKKVVVADCAYSNGGDRDLLDYLVEEKVFLNLHAYKGWNTNANTLGTALAQGCISSQLNEAVLKANLYHLLDDYLYQAVVRMSLTQAVLPDKGLNYFDLKDQTQEVNRLIRQAIMDAYTRDFNELAHQVIPGDFQTSSPWNRMFETELTFNLETKRGHFKDEL